MFVGRSLPPVAVPMNLETILAGLKGMLCGEAEVDRFREELKDWSGLEGCFLLSSGKAALTVALKALRQLSPGRDEVLIPAYTCYSVPSAVVHAGCKVRVCDISPETFDFDYRQLGRKLDNRRLLAVIPCHLFGRPADIPRLKSLVPDPQVAIVEDAAQAFGSRHRGELLGTQGALGIFSLGRGKALSTVSGGILVTRHQDIARAVQTQVAALPKATLNRQLQSLGYALALLLFQRPSLYWLPRLLPWLRLGETIFDSDFSLRCLAPFQAGLARNWEARLRWLQGERRDRISLLQASVGTGSGFGLPPRDEEGPDWLRLPLLMPSAAARRQLLSSPRAGQLGIVASYPDAVSAITELQDDVAEAECPNARWLARHLVTVPVHPYLKPQDVQRIVQTLVDATGTGSDGEQVAAGPQAKELGGPAGYSHCCEGRRL